MARITPVKGGFFVKHSTREVFGVDDDDANGFDYKNQAWVVDGRYVACGHRKPCTTCFGTLHVGERPAEGVEVR